MSRVVRFHEIGGPEVLKVEEVEVATPNRARSGSGLRHSA